MASPNDLCTLQEVCEWMTMAVPVNSTPEYNVLTRLITGASMTFAQLCNRDFFAATDLTERRNGNGAERMVVRTPPVISGISLVINGVTVPQSPDGVQSGWLCDDNSFYLIGGGAIAPGAHLGPAAPRFYKGVQNVVLGYRSGFEPVPEDVTQAVIELVTQKYKRRATAEKQSESLGGQSITFTRADVPQQIRDLTEQYRIRFRPD